MLNISDIQHFSVGDGNGIRTTVFFKGCNLRCPWCHNPENISIAPTELYFKSTGERKISGRLLSQSEVLAELLEDRDFYIQSGGGVTLSGGEVMLQAKEVLPLIKLLKENGIDVLIDTAGCVPYKNFGILNPYVDGYLFDFKTADAEKYRQIGGNLSLVSHNLGKLRYEGKKVFVRIPLIPTFNTDEKEIEKICLHLKTYDIEEVYLLPFHRLGSAKYEAMGLEYGYKDVVPLSAVQISQIEKQYKKYFNVNVER